ncbi:unnamed protein product [Diatraea saccharalis]|uniref:Uncharacterized protein n=1 Tax=Diatraea saccharalis TaxID=40085 RepID=A0A9N9R6T3_9NEOP|nr:unnamed protein product [Diatraea saccharalis]
MHKVLHRFPNPDKDMERFKTWVYAIGPILLGLEDKYIYKYRRVCRSHFIVKHCCRNNRISNIALPILNMPDVTKDIHKNLCVPKVTQKHLDTLQSSTPEALAPITNHDVDYSWHCEDVEEDITEKENFELFCCCCLTTQVKTLYDLNKINLKIALEEILGYEKSETDNGRQYICACCATLLMKCIEFRERCRRADALVQKLRSVDMLGCSSSVLAWFSSYLHGRQQAVRLKMEYVTSIERPYYSLDMNLSISEPLYMCTDEFVEENKADVENEKIREKGCMKCEKRDVLIEKEPDNEVKDQSKSIIDEAERLNDVKKQKDPDVLLDAEEDVDDVEFFVHEKPKKHVFRVEMYEEKYNMDVVSLTPEQQVMDMQSRKLTDNYLKASHRCESCSKGFFSEATLVNHYNATHHPDLGDHVCDLCTARFKHRRMLTGHMLTHRYRFKCKLCDFSTTRKYTVKGHHNWHQGVRFTCERCGKTFIKKTSFLSHVRIQHPNEEVWCRYCGESFISDSGLRTHRRLMHTNVIEFICAKCGEAFLNSEALAVHNNVECSEFPCARCGESFNDQKLLKVHVLARHAKSVGLSRKCEVCSKIFRNYTALKHHCELTSGVCLELSPCPQCGDSFESEELLQMHVTSAHRIHCIMCNKTFASEPAFAIHHKRVHLGVKINKSLVVCEICGKKCINNAYYLKHRRIHNGEMYECTECPKKFSLLHRFKDHLRVHTGETPYKCKLCPKAFKRHAGLHRHKTVHTGAKPYACPQCGRCFSQSNSMKAHVRAVHLKIPAPYRDRRQRSEKLKTTIANLSHANKNDNQNILC